jgi:glutathionylspermidine synthase
VIDQVNNLKLQHLVELSKLGDGCVEIEARIRAWLDEHDVVFNGGPIPFVLMPHFVSPRQVKRVRHAVACLSRVLDRFCDAYPTDARLREELAVPEAEDELIRLDPGYPRPLRICRLDAFLRGYDVKFLEFNADSAAGIGYTDILYEGLDSAIDLPPVRSEFDTSYTPMLPRLVATLLDAYAQFRSRDMPERPRLALVDVEGSPAVPEFRIVCHAASAAGVDARHCLLSDLDYDGLVLRAGGEPVELVYRRALLEDVLAADAQALLAALRDGRVCMVNPFRSRVANNKKLFALLDDPRFADREELEAIRETIPWTRVLRDGRATYGEWVVDLLPFTSDNRERLVLKPASDYGGHQVALGIETEQADWDGLIEEHAPAGDFVVQEYIPVPQEMFPTVHEGHIHMQLKHFNINPFGIGGQYAGMITRISDRAVINVSAGGGLLPSVIGRHHHA